MRSVATRSFLSAYRLAWEAALPVLMRNPRLRDGWATRSGDLPLPRADLWIQAASAGEAHLAVTLLTQLNRLDHSPAEMKPSVLVTTNTRQGMDILSASLSRNDAETGAPPVHSGFFPFDHPRIMERAVSCIQPRLAVLLETEIWPAMLTLLKERGIPAILLNGRLSERSLRGYGLCPGFWRRFGPERVLAVTKRDAERFRRLVPSHRVGVMPNIKFDRLSPPRSPGEHMSDLRACFAARRPVITFGSVRREEEADAILMIRQLLKQNPRLLIAVFPRHLFRLPHWQRHLSRRGIPWILRSDLTEPPASRSVVLWDRFGELNFGYAIASGAFVGGSLAPLGGQNFLEPLTAGVPAVIGPYWKDFYWIGEEIFRSGIVVRTPGWRSAAAQLAAWVRHPPERSGVRERALAYIHRRQGGSVQAAKLIRRFLSQAG